MKMHPSFFCALRARFFSICWLYLTAESGVPPARGTSRRIGPESDPNWSQIGPNETETGFKLDPNRTTFAYFCICLRISFIFFARSARDFVFFLRFSRSARAQVGACVDIIWSDLCQISVQFGSDLGLIWVGFDPIESDPS